MLEKLTFKLTVSSSFLLYERDKEFDFRNCSFDFVLCRGFFFKLSHEPAGVMLFSMKKLDGRLRSKELALSFEWAIFPMKCIEIENSLDSEV